MRAVSVKSQSIILAPMFSWTQCPCTNTWDNAQMEISQNTQTCHNTLCQDTYQICAKVFTGNEVLERTSLASTPSQNNIKLLILHTHTHPFNGPLSRTTRVGRYQKGKTNLDFTEARDSEWRQHQSAPCSRQITTPAPHHSVFYRPDALPAAQPTASKHWTINSS